MMQTNQRPNTLDVKQSQPYVPELAEYPWIKAAEIEVPTVLVTLPDGTEFRYGSLIGLNNRVTKIADSVPDTASASVQNVLFAGLPSVLKGERDSGISRVENTKSKPSTLFAASRNLSLYTRLIFALEGTKGDNQIPVVLKAGISDRNDHAKLLNVLGVVQAGGRKRKK